MSEVPDQTREEWIATPERERREVESTRTIPDQTRDRWADKQCEHPHIHREEIDFGFYGDGEIWLCVLCGERVDD